MSDELTGLFALGARLDQEFESTGEPDTLQHAVDVYFRAALLARADRTAHAYARACIMRCLQAGDDGTSSYRRFAATCLMVVSADPQSADHAAAANFLLQQLQERWLGTRAFQHLGSLVRMVDAMHALITPRPADRDRLALVLAMALTESFVIEGDGALLARADAILADLSTRLETAGELAAYIRNGNDRVRALRTSRVARLALLGDILWGRYQHSMKPAHLDEAVVAMRQIVDEAGTDHPDRVMYLKNLANSLLRQAQMAEDSSQSARAAQDAIDAAQTAMDAMSEDLRLRPECLLLGGYSLLILLRLSMTSELADRTCTMLREAVESLAGTSLQAHAYGLLSDALGCRAEIVSEQAAAEDIRQSVAAARSAIELVALDSPEHTDVVSALILALLRRFRAEGDARDLTEALDVARRQAQDFPDERGRSDLVIIARLLEASESGTGDSETAALVAGLSDEAILARARDMLSLALDSRDESLTTRLVGAGEWILGVRGDALAPARFLVTAADRLDQRGRPREAAFALTRAADGFAAAGEKAGQANALSRLGLVNMHLSAWDAAVETFGRSAHLYRDLGRTPDEVQQRIRAADAMAAAGDHCPAIERYRTSIEVCRSECLPDLEAHAQLSCGIAYRTIQDAATALVCLERALVLFETLADTVGVADATIALAEIRIESDDLDEAASQVEHGARICLSADDWQTTGRILAQHINALIAGGHGPTAAAHETQLLDLLRRHGAPREPADFAYSIAQRHRDAGDAPGALQAFHAARAEYLGISDMDGVASADQNIGTLHASSGNPDLALAAFRDAAEQFARLGSSAKAAGSHAAAAAILAMSDRLDEAASELNEAERFAAMASDTAPMFAVTIARAKLELVRGRSDAAAGCLARAQQLASGEPLPEALVYEERARLAQHNGDLTAEIEALDLAVEFFRDGGAPQLAAAVLVRLGLALERRGDASRARDALEEGTDQLLRHSAAPPAAVYVGGYMIASDLGVDAGLLVRLAMLHAQAGDRPRLFATLRRALELDTAAMAHHEVVEALRHMVDVEDAARAGNLPQALSLARDALARVDAARAPHGTKQVILSALLGDVSVLARELGELEAAYDYAARGAALSDADDASSLHATHLLNLGIAERELGRIDEAIGHLEQAARLAARPRAGDQETRALILNSLGLTLTERGRWAEAERVFAAGLALTADTLPRRSRASLLSSRAGLHLARRDLDAALVGFREAIAINEELGGDHALAGDYANLALVYRERGETTQARALTERALAIERASGQRRGVVLDLTALGMLEDDDEAAARCFEEALSIAQDIGFDAGRGLALSNLGAIDTRRGRYSEAYSRLSEAIDLTAQTGQVRKLAVAFYNRSSAALGLDRLERALEDALRAAELAELLAGTPDAEASGDAQLELQILDRLLMLTDRMDRGELAWERVERAKARTLTTQLGYQQWPAPTGVESAALAEEQRLLDEVRTLQALLSASAGPGRQQALRARISAAKSELGALWDNIEPTAPDYVALRRESTVDAAHLMARATTGNAASTLGFLSFHTTDDTVTVLAYRAGQSAPSVRRITVGAELLRRFLGTYGREVPGLLEMPSGERLDADLHRVLSDMLLGDALGALGDDLDLLYLLPHGLLNLVPLHMLAPGGRALIDRWPIAYAPSGSVLNRLLNRPQPRDDGTPLVLGYTPHEDERFLFEGEAEDVAHAFGVKPLLGKAAVSSAVPGSRGVVHFSCHGVFDEADPFGSGVSLADGLLQARQIMSMRLDAELVVLSACDTARSAASGVDDVAGLGHALLYAGARSALLTLWPVDAGAARTLMHGFYANLHSGLGKAVALRQAMLDLRDSGQYGDPVFWAPFVLIGNGG